MNNERYHFRMLDLFRGVAALGVAAFHYRTNWAGYLACDFFLVLSGFILTHSYLSSDKKIDVSDFVVRRLARLYPLHIFTLITFIGASLLYYGELKEYREGNLFTFVQQLFLVQNIGLNPHGLTWNYPSWTISVEFWVNVFFILYITRATSSALLLFVSIFCVLLIYTAVGHFDLQARNIYGFVNTGMLRGIASFFMGIIAYRIYIYWRNNAAVLRSCHVLEILCIVAVYILIFWREKRYNGMDMFAPYVFTFVVVIFALEKGFLSMLFKKFSWIGIISYSIYLNQLTVLYTIRHIYKYTSVPHDAKIWLYLLVLCLYSWITYLIIEKPLKRLMIRGGRTLIKKDPEPVVPAS